jgi:hypothetical protein
VDTGHIRELVPLGALDNAIEDEDISVGLGLEDEHVLVKGLFGAEDFVDLEGHRLARPLRRDLAEPAICMGRQQQVLENRKKETTHRR